MTRQHTHPPQVGNDPCPCGSSRKYKRCYGERRTAAARSGWSAGSACAF
ncbi:SEC-C metal-binding domain-containing protein [Chelatococcus asaccharovorans]